MVIVEGVVIEKLGDEQAFLNVPGSGVLVHTLNALDARNHLSDESHKKSMNNGMPLFLSDEWTFILALGKAVKYSLISRSFLEGVNSFSSALFSTASIWRIASIGVVVAGLMVCVCPIGNVV